MINNYSDTWGIHTIHTTIVMIWVREWLAYKTIGFPGKVWQLDNCHVIISYWMYVILVIGYWIYVCTILILHILIHTILNLLFSKIWFTWFIDIPWQIIWILEYQLGAPSTGCAQGVRQMPDVAGLGRDQGKLERAKEEKESLGAIASAFCEAIFCGVKQKESIKKHQKNAISFPSFSGERQVSFSSAGGLAAFAERGLQMLAARFRCFLLT